MKIGIHSYTYHLSFGAHEYKPKKPITLYDFMDKVASFGYEGIQIDPMHMASHSLEYINEILNYAKQKNLFIEFGACGIEANYLRDNLEMARILEADILRTFIGFNRFDKNINLAKEIDYAVDQLNLVKDKAEKMNIKIAIENHCDVSTDELIDIVKRVNSTHIGVCADIGNVMICQEDSVEAMTKMAPYAITTHFKDYKSQMTNYGYKVYGVPLGEGNIDISTAMNIIKSISLDKVIMEIPSEQEATDELCFEKEDRVARESILYARNVLNV